MAVPQTQTANAGITTTTTFWNPGEVLQIIDENRKKKLTYKVICAGRAVTRYNARCRWAIEDQSPEYAAATIEVLDGLARTPPTEVTDAQLETLALHCLCTHHGYQIDTVVGEFKQRLEPVVRHYQLRIVFATILFFLSLGYFNINLGAMNVAQVRQVEVTVTQDNVREYVGREETGRGRNSQREAAGPSRKG